jgi:hypothetical protein
MTTDRRRKKLGELLKILKLYIEEKMEPKQIARLVGKSPSWIWKQLRRVG